MIYHLKAVLTQDELTELRAIAARVRWDDGRKTAGPIAAPLKHNTEAPHDSREAQAAADEPADDEPLHRGHGLRRSLRRGDHGWRRADARRSVGDVVHLRSGRLRRRRARQRRD